MCVSIIKYFQFSVGFYFTFTSVVVYIYIVHLQAAGVISRNFIRVKPEFHDIAKN